MKRSGEEMQNGAADGQPLSGSGSNKRARTEDDDVDDDDLPLYAPSRLSSQKRQGKECPYLDTVSRQVQHTLFVEQQASDHHSGFSPARTVVLNNQALDILLSEDITVDAIVCSADVLPSCAGSRL